jgi:hypothetical protein
VVDALETVAKTTEHFAISRFACHREIVDAPISVIILPRPVAVASQRSTRPENPRCQDQPLPVSGPRRKANGIKW